jgi:hypothetical protein
MENKKASGLIETKATSRYHSNYLRPHGMDLSRFLTLHNNGCHRPGLHFSQEIQGPCSRIAIARISPSRTLLLRHVSFTLPVDIFSLRLTSIIAQLREECQYNSQFTIYNAQFTIHNAQCTIHCSLSFIQNISPMKSKI